MKYNKSKKKFGLVWILSIFLILVFTLAACRIIEKNSISTNGELVNPSPETNDNDDEINPMETGEVIDTETLAIYNNPIDKYFLPKIEQASFGAERSSYQDTYKGVWKSEYENIIKWMKKKCIYKKDKNKLIAYDASVQKSISVTNDVLITDWMENYNLPPDSPDRNSWGTGTRSGLNQVEAQIYRDAGMRLIGVSDDYKFLKRDYANEHYE